MSKVLLKKEELFFKKGIFFWANDVVESHDMMGRAKKILYDRLYEQYNIPRGGVHKFMKRNKMKVEETHVLWEWAWILVIRELYQYL